jgi:hypothetical protein
VQACPERYFDVKRSLVEGTTDNERDPDGERLYWNNADGWVSRATATVFTSGQRMRLNLPIGGRWVER